MKYGLAVITSVLVAAPAFAITVDVPEIDAGAGTAALAALGASVALIWQRRRK